MLKLQTTTDPAWAGHVVANLGAFLADHAACERKASATAMSLVCHYPDRVELVDAMVELAEEELAHFVQVYRHIRNRGLSLRPDTKDPYVGGLLKHLGREPESYFLDRLVIGGVVEARGCERFGLLADALDDVALKEFYREFARAESRHHALFMRLAKTYFPDERVERRLAELLDIEAELVDELPVRAALH